MALFLSTYTNRIDKKGRVSLPAPFRTALGEDINQGIVVFRAHQHPCLEGFDWMKMDEIGDRMDHYDLFSQQQDDLATTIFGESVQLFCDGDGRIVLPADLIEAAGLDEHATFVGLGRKFQIWSPELFAARKAQARSAVLDQKLTIPQTGREGV
tara:strand:- start:11794 stop:12255 length:462 start_codon:yes stop_codon:yes gene_type:complete